MTRGNGDWEAVFATVRGAMHDARGLPNQDAVATREFNDGGRVIVAAVSDGHGGDRYVRSHVGAQFAVVAACEAVEATVTRGGTLDRVASRLPEDIVERWQALVESDLETTPFTPEEQHLSGVNLVDEPLIPYGATLLVALARGDELVLLQLGDGDIIVATPEGSHSPIPADERLVGGHTTSLCLPTATRDFRTVSVKPYTRPDLVILSSDGYGNSFADANWRARIASDLRRQIENSGLATVGEELPGWLADSARAAGDDVTVAVLRRSLPEAITAERTDDLAPCLERRVQPGTSLRPEISRRPTLGPAVLVIVAIISFVVGWFVRAAVDDGGSSPTPASSGAVGGAPTGSSSRVVVAGPAGSRITFDAANPQTPGARKVQSGEVGSAVTRVEVGERVFEITARSRLTLRSEDEEPISLTIRDGFEPGSLVVAEGYLWVIDSEENLLAVFDIDGAKPRLLAISAIG